MTTLTADVGPKASNLSHDVTLVQAMLQAIAQPSGRRYYDTRYDGIFGPITAAAIVAFQTDRGISGPGLGTVNMATTTWKQLLQALPPDRQGMRIMMGTSIVYLAASQSLLSRGQARLQVAKFRPGFAPRVGNLIREMYQRHGIALFPDEKKGAYRTFKDQWDLHTNIGPGDSLHNFGLAVDVYFNPLTLVKPNGALTSAIHISLQELEILNMTTWLAFWNARDRIARGHGLYPIGISDRPHLRHPANVSGGRSLVAHLNSRGKMKWELKSGPPNVYKCDLGGGRMLVDVGTSAQIWQRHANLTTQTIGQAFGIPATQVGPGDINKFRQALQDEYRWAESNWLRWQPKP